MAMPITHGINGWGTMQPSLQSEESLTNFYRVLRIRQVKYSVFVLPKNEERDQTLLEAELHMRNQYKKGLFYQANKELWAFGLNDEEVPVPLDKFNMKSRETNIFLPSMMFSKSSTDDNVTSSVGQSSMGSLDSKGPNILYSILLNSIKKKILINLSMKNYITPFGNASIINPASQSSKFSELMFVDPQIYSNGNVLISIATKPSSLLSLSRYLSNGNKSSINNTNYALYLAPSGIRAYFANHSLVDSLTPTPSNHQNLFIMLQLLIGIVFNKQLHEIKWVKLIPDLKHLNGLTPQISKFLRPVQNQKFVIWPLDLCYVQKGEFLATFKPASDPFELFDEFVEMYKLSDKIGTWEAHHTSPRNLNGNSPQESPDKFIPSNTEQKQPSSEPKTSESPKNWNDLDEELFGEKNEVTDADFNFFDDDDDKETEVKADPVEIGKQPPSKAESQQHEEEVAKNVNVPNMDESESINSRPMFDIPKDEMCLPPSPFLYSDPGAPLPVTNSPRLSSQSVFSPLKFNPVIRDAVDNKYDKGGKFYVPDNQQEKPSVSRRSSNVDSRGLGDGLNVQQHIMKNEDYSVVVHSSDEDLTSDSESDSQKDDDDEESLNEEPLRGGDELKNTQESVGKPDLATLQAEVTSVKHVLYSDLTDKSSTTNQATFNNLSTFYTANSKVEPSINFQNISTPDLPSTKVFSRERSLPTSAANTPEENVQLTTNKEMPAGKPKQVVRCHDSSNWIPFLTKSIPLYTIPGRFFYNNPEILENKLKDVLPFLVNAVAFDFSLLDKYIVKPLNLKEAPFKGLAEYNHSTTLAQTNTEINSDTNLDMDDFETYFDSMDLDCSNVKPDESHRNLELAIKSLFSSVKQIKLAEYAGVTEENDLLSTFIAPDDDEPNDYIEGTYQKEVKDHFFRIEPPVCKAKRMNQDLTIDFVALKFWKVLSLSPLHEQRKYKVILIVNEANDSVQPFQDLLQAIIRNYESCGLGTLFPFDGKELKLRINSLETDKAALYQQENGQKFDQVLDHIENGVFNVNYQGTSLQGYYDLLEEKLDLLGKVLLRMDFQKKERLLLLFSNKRLVDLHSLLKCITCFKKFHRLQQICNPESTPCFHILPADLYLQNGSFTFPSANRLTKLSLAFYNGPHNDLYASLTQSAPKSINFQLTKQPSNLLNEESFIHLAYERSADKNWCVASWSDQWGKVRKVKAWYCYPIGNLSKSGNTKLAAKDNVRKPFEQVTNEMWKETFEFIKHVTGKTYLVLTRLNGVILDDELAHWKRLSLGTNLLIILLTVNSNPRLVLNDLKICFPFSKIFFQAPRKPNDDDLLDPKASPGNGSYHTPYMGESPGFKVNDQFFAPGLVRKSLPDLEISDLNNNLRLLDIEQEFYGVVLKNSIPLSNSSNKITFKTGYLVKPSKNSKDGRLLTFEVNLLSYPSFFNSKDLLRDLLGQYRNLAAVNELVGSYCEDIAAEGYGGASSTEFYDNINNTTHSNDSIIPWHILAVKKVLNVLTHIRVE